MQIRALPPMSTDDFIKLAKETEQRALAEPVEARKRRALYLSKIDYNSLDANDRDHILNSKLFRSRLITIFSDENYIHHAEIDKAMNRGFAGLTRGKTVRKLEDFQAKIEAQRSARIAIAKASIELFDQFYAILLNEKDIAKQKEKILQLEKKLADLKAMYIANKSQLLGEPVVSMATVENTIAEGLAAIRPFLTLDSEEMDKCISNLQGWRDGIAKWHDQIPTLAQMIGNYPVQVLRWVADVFFAARKNSDFEAISLRVKTEIQTELKGPFSKLRNAATLAHPVVSMPTTPAETKGIASPLGHQSHAATMVALSAVSPEHKEQMLKSRYDVKEPEEKENYHSAESKAKIAAAESKAKVAAATSIKEAKDQKSVYSASSSAMMKAPVKSGSGVVPSSLARSGAQVVARPAG